MAQYKNFPWYLFYVPPIRSYLYLSTTSGILLLLQWYILNHGTPILKLFSHTVFIHLHANSAFLKKKISQSFHTRYHPALDHGCDYGEER
jgi:hypothetical protein